MGYCVKCGKKTGLLRGKKIMNSNEYCYSCYENISTIDTIDGWKQYQERFNIPQNPYLLSYVGGFDGIDKFTEINLLKGIVYKKDRMISGNMFFWIKDNNLMFALSHKVEESKFSNQEIIDLVRYLEDLREKGKISSEEFSEKRSLFLMKNDYIIISCIQKNLGCQPIASIKKENVLFFSRVGDIYTKSSGGGFNLTGAIVGGIIGSGIGAVIGSRNKIVTELIDERNTVLMIKENDEIKSIFFTSTTYDLFLKVLPDKDINTVNVSIHDRKTDNFEDEIIIKIKKLDELRIKGILTAEEFEERKKTILDKFLG